MAAPSLGGLTGLYGPEVPHGQQGRDPSNFGTGPDPSHKIPGDQSQASQALAQGTRYGPVVEVGDDVDSTPAAGEVFDTTPDSHAAPYPRGIEQDPVAAALQYQALHSLNLGGGRQGLQVGTPYPVELTASRDDSPNMSELAEGMPGQLRTGNDVDHGYGTTPGHGFGFGRLFRRVFHDNVPTDRTGTVHGERPFWGAWPIRQNLLNGEDSPYGEAGDISLGMHLGPTPTGPPTPYLQPPNPTVAAATTYDSEAGFVGGWLLG